MYNAKMLSNKLKKSMKIYKDFYFNTKFVFYFIFIFLHLFTKSEIYFFLLYLNNLLNINKILKICYIAMFFGRNQKKND